MKNVIIAVLTALLLINGYFTYRLNQSLESTVEKVESVKKSYDKKIEDMKSTFKVDLETSRVEIGEKLGKAIEVFQEKHQVYTSEYVRQLTQTIAQSDDAYFNDPKVQKIQARFNELMAKQHLEIRNYGIGMGVIKGDEDSDTPKAPDNKSKMEQIVDKLVAGGMNREEAMKRVAETLRVDKSNQ